MDSLLIEDHGMLIRSIDQSLTVSEVGMVRDCHTVMMIAKSDFRIVWFGDWYGLHGGIRNVQMSLMGFGLD